MDSGSHPMVESKWAGAFDVVTEVHSGNPGVCMGAGKGEIFLGKGCEESIMAFVGACKAA